MKDQPVVRVEFEEAKQLADLTAIFLDLKFVREVLVRVLKLLDEDSKDSVLLRSYWTAALIAYARCFATGKRFGLSASIFSHREGAIDVHIFAENLRDKHIAHSVNPFEQTTVGLVLTPQDATQREVERVASLYMSHYSPDREGVKSFIAIVQIALEYVKNEAKKWEAKTLEAGRRLPIEDLYARERLRLTAPGPDHARKPRGP